MIDQITFTAKGGTRFVVNLDEPDPCVMVTLVGHYAAESVISNPRPNLAELTVRIPIDDLLEFLDWAKAKMTAGVVDVIGKFLAKVVV